MARSTESESVLVVEDEETLARLYQRWLTEAGYRVRVANSGESALERCGDDYDVVCLDRQLPGKSGAEVLSRLRTRGMGARVAMITGVEPDFDVVEMAFDDYLVKPVARQELLDAVSSLSRLSTYDAAVREYFALSSKKAVLAENRSTRELRDSDEYGRLVARLEEAESAVSDVASDFDHDEFETLFRDFESPVQQSY